MAQSILLGAIDHDRSLPRLLAGQRYEPIDELPWSDSGAYISRSALDPADQAALREVLEKLAKSGAVWKAFRQYYPAQSLTGSIRSR